MDENPRGSDSASWSDSGDIFHFFHNEVNKAQNSLGIRLVDTVEVYLVQLLCNFVRATDHNTLNSCLVHLLKQALESSNGEKIIFYKRLADTALYFAGFYQEYFANKTFDIKYYISMGASAYKTLSTLTTEKKGYQNTMSKVYMEMNKNFLTSVDVLLCVSEHVNQTQKSRSTLNLYDAWVNTESQKLEKDLLARGVIPLPKLSRKSQ